jgi:hypothetical protein
MMFMGEKQGEGETYMSLIGEREEEDQSKLNRKTQWPEN